MASTATAEQQTQPGQKVCGGACQETLPLDDFPVNRAQPDGRHVYCKACTLEQVHAHRARLKDYKAAKQKRALANTPKAGTKAGAEAEVKTKNPDQQTNPRCSKSARSGQSGTQDIFEDPIRDGTHSRPGQ